MWQLLVGGFVNNMKETLATIGVIVTLVTGGAVYERTTITTDFRGVGKYENEYQFARLNKDNVVIEVVASTEEDIYSGKHGDPATFARASHETVGKKNPFFAGIGYTYNPLTTRFTPPQWIVEELERGNATST